MPRARDVLAPYERPVREDLREWAARLSRRIDRDADAASIAGALNNAALVFSHLGFTDVARWACASQLEWLAGRSRRDPFVLGLAFQPYVNLGRLETFTGAGSAARERFGRLLAFQSASPVVLGPCTVAAEHWETITAADPQLPTILSSTYVIDSLKSWFVERRYEAAQHFLGELRLELLRLPPVAVHEGKVICHVELGQHERALDEAVSWHHSDTFMPAIVGLHLLRSVVALGDPDTARSQARVLAELATGDRWVWIPAPSRLRYLERLAQSLGALELHEEERRVLYAYYDLAQEISDQVSMFSALVMLDGITRGDERRRLRRLRDGLAARCDYFVVRRWSGMAPSTPVDTDPYVRLAERIEKVLEVVTSAPSF